MKRKYFDPLVVRSITGGHRFLLIGNKIGMRTEHFYSTVTMSAALKHDGGKSI